MQRHLSRIPKLAVNPPKHQQLPLDPYGQHRHQRHDSTLTIRIRRSPTEACTFHCFPPLLLPVPGHRIHPPHACSLPVFGRYIEHAVSIPRDGRRTSCTSSTALVLVADRARSKRPRVDRRSRIQFFRRPCTQRTRPIVRQLRSNTLLYRSINPKRRRSSGLHQLRAQLQRRQIMQ